MIINPITLQYLNTLFDMSNTNNLDEDIRIFLEENTNLTANENSTRLIKNDIMKLLSQLNKTGGKL